MRMTPDVHVLAQAVLNRLVEALSGIVVVDLFSESSLRHNASLNENSLNWINLCAG